MSHCIYNATAEACRNLAVSSLFSKVSSRIIGTESGHCLSNYLIISYFAEVYWLRSSRNQRLFSKNWQSMFTVKVQACHNHILIRWSALGSMPRLFDISKHPFSRCRLRLHGCQAYVYLEQRISDTEEDSTRHTLFVLFTLRSFHLVTSDLTVNLEYNVIKYDSHIKILIESLSKDSEYWKHITNFTFRSEHETCRQGVADPKLARFLTLLTSVKILKIKQFDILYIILQLREEENYPIIFPEMEFIETSDGITTSTLGTLLDFLDYRVDFGKPIRTLTLKRQVRALSVNLEPLNRFAGLKIVWWGNNEYICGGKNPSKINFSAHPA